MASQAVLRALEGLSNVLYRGQRDIGQTRLAQARLGLEETRTKYDIDRQKMLDIPREEEARQIQERREAGKQPLTRHTWHTVFGGDAADIINRDMEIEKHLKLIGVKFNDATGAYEKGGQVITHEDAFGRRSSIRAIIMGVLDPNKDAESRGEKPDPQSQIALYEKKLEAMRYLQQYETDPAVIRFSEGKIKDAQKKIERLQKQIPTPAQELQTGLLKYRGEALKAQEARGERAEQRDIRAEARSKREHELKMKKLKRGISGSAKVQLFNHLEGLGIDAEDAVDLVLRFKKAKSDSAIYSDTYQALIKAYANWSGNQPPEEKLKEFDAVAKSVVESVRKMRPTLFKKRKKGVGYFSELKRPDGSISTELSIGVKINGKETEIPTLVPTLTQQEINFLLQGNEPSKQIIDKAVTHAKKRMAKGKSPFAQRGEKIIETDEGEIERRYMEARRQGYSKEVAGKISVGKKRGGATGGF